MSSPHKVVRIRNVAGAIYCHAGLDQHSVVAWDSGGQVFLTPALWVSSQYYWKGGCQEKGKTAHLPVVG